MTYHETEVLKHKILVVIMSVAGIFAIFYGLPLGAFVFGAFWHYLIACLVKLQKEGEPDAKKNAKS